MASQKVESLVVDVNNAAGRGILKTLLAKPVANDVRMAVVDLK